MRRWRRRRWRRIGRCDGRGTTSRLICRAAKRRPAHPEPELAVRRWSFRPMDRVERWVSSPPVVIVSKLVSIFRAVATHALWHRLRHALLRLITPRALAGSVLGFGVVLSLAWLVSPLSARPPRADLAVDPVGALLFTALAAALWFSTRMPRLSRRLALAVAAVAFAGVFGALPALFAARLPIDAAFGFALCAGAFVFRHQPHRGLRTGCAVALRGVVLLAG